MSTEIKPNGIIAILDEETPDRNGRHLTPEDEKAAALPNLPTDNHATNSLQQTKDTAADPSRNLQLLDTEEEVIIRKVRQRNVYDSVQEMMWRLWRIETGSGPRILKMSGTLVGFIVLALWFNFHSRGFSNQEAMEAAHLGRHLAAWRGYTTFSIRPATLGLLQRADPAHAQDVLQHPVPDLSIAPGYPFVLACLMKVLPFNFAVNPTHLWSYQPELMIVVFNEVLFFAAVLLLFALARRLFDPAVAWMSAIIFTGSETCWKFNVSGLSTTWLLVIFLLVAWCLALVEERENQPNPPPPGGSLALAAGCGALVGIGGLSRYSFAWMIVPVALFLSVFFKRNRAKLALAAAVLFLLVMAPWIARNLVLSRTPFGTASYAMLENTRPLEEDRVQRTFDPFAAGLSRLRPRDVVHKLVANAATITRNDLPHLGGNWTWSFFLCGLLLPFRNRTSGRLRLFLVGTLGVTAIVQALGQTHLSVESPEINTENLLVLLAPLVVMFGTSFFFTLLDQTPLPSSFLRKAAAGLFAVVMCAPLLMDIFSPPAPTIVSPYSPYRIQKTAAMMSQDELMMSDVPWAVAWIGERPCSWLTLNEAKAFTQVNDLKPVQAIYLTQRTSDRPFLSEIIDYQAGWPRFMFNTLPKPFWPQGAVPPGFPLTKSPAAYMPGQVFISDRVRWNITPKR